MASPAINCPPEALCEARGVWHDFVLHVVWSSNPDLGFIELWYDGQKAIDGKAVQTLFPGMVNYLKQGLYRDSSISAVGVVYHDGMTVGTTLADVAPQLVPTPPPPPEPPDAGTPDPGAGAAPDAGAVAPPVQAARPGIAFPHQGCSSAGSARAAPAAGRRSRSSAPISTRHSFPSAPT